MGGGAHYRLLSRRPGVWGALLDSALCRAGFQFFPWFPVALPVVSTCGVVPCPTPSLLNLLPSSICGSSGTRLLVCTEWWLGGQGLYLLLGKKS